MATTITMPSGYKSIKKPIIVQITKDTTAVMPISINGYIKQVIGRNVDVNISPYCDSISPNPILTAGLQAGLSALRVAKATVIADDNSYEVNVIDALANIPSDRILTDLRHRYITASDIEEIAVLSSAGGIVRVGATDTDVTGYAVATVIPTTNSVVSYIVDDVVVDSITYTQINGFSGVRLAWVNRYGAIDFWNFDVIQSKELKATKTKIYTADGYMSTEIKAEDTVKLSTRLLDDDTINALSQIIYADKVWVINGSSYTGIDIITDNVQVYQHDTLSSLSIEYRPVKRTL